MRRTEELANAISDCVTVDITTGDRTIESGEIPRMIDHLNQNGWLDHLKLSTVPNTRRQSDGEAEKPWIYMLSGVLAGATATLVAAALICNLN